jgi:hypothetical protein
MSTLTFENLSRHVGHRIVAEHRGLPPQSVVLRCADCDESIIELDAEGEAEAGLGLLEPVGPQKPTGPPPLAVGLPLPVAA